MSHSSRSLAPPSLSSFSRSGHVLKVRNGPANGTSKGRVSSSRKSSFAKSTKRRRRTKLISSSARTREASLTKKLLDTLLPLSCALFVPILLFGLVACDEVSSSPKSQGGNLRITIQPQDLIAIEGESTELNCDADGGESEPTIEWFHNGQLISSSSQSRTTMGGSIQLLDVRPPGEGVPSDAGRYQCVARTSDGAEARSRNATLQVAYIKPDFLAAPQDKLAAVGDSATFDCLPLAWPEPQISWRLNGRLIKPDGAKLSVQRIARADLSAARLAALRAEPPAPPPRQAGLADQPDGKLVDVFGSRLVLSQVDKNDEGQYSCLVETKATHKLVERESPAGQLSVFVRPYFIEAPQNSSAQVGGQVRLRCRMGGDPEPVISWRKQNGRPLSEKITIDSSDKTLILDGLRLTDQGIYICEGENSVGSARAMAQVSVNSRPRFTVQPTDREVEFGGQVQIKCSGEASPPPMLFWYKEGHRQLMFPKTTSSNPSRSHMPWLQAAPLVAPDGFRSPYGSGIPTSDISPAINNLFTTPLGLEQLPYYQSNHLNNYFGNRIYVDNQGTLNIINATHSDTGYYSCALISTVGSVMAKAKVTVKQNNQFGSPQDYYANPQDQIRSSQSSAGKYDFPPPPVIKMGSSNQTLPTNTSIELLCEVVSQVAYKIQWYFESQPIQEDPPRITVLDSGFLSINNLRTSDSGVYTCVVTAANDQNMPIASPYEPLDTSMLTSAPPVQPQTTHSCTLKVANPINPNIQFYRMDKYAYPTAPGPAYLLSTNGEDAITIGWTPPADSGILPVKFYIVEHYDTSQEHLGWRVIHRLFGKESLLIDGLLPEGSHFFVIRASNSQGTGPSSPIAGPMRTVAGEKRYQLELQRRKNPTLVDQSELRPETSSARERLTTIITTLQSLTPVTSSGIRLQWSMQIAQNSSLDDFIDGFPSNNPGSSNLHEGYSIRFRAIGLGENPGADREMLPSSIWNPINSPSPLPLVTSYVDDEVPAEIYTTRSRRDLANYFDFTQEFNEVRVADHNIEHYTISGLKPFTTYQFFVVPYYKDIDGVPSNILTAQTFEDRPSVAPPNLTIRPINNTAIRLLWLHIPSIYSNGILKGYTIRVNSSGIYTDQQSNLQTISSTPKILNLPLDSLVISPLITHNSETDAQPNLNVQHRVVMYDITNLTHKSFYSIQVAGSTSAGQGPWSESQNFVMDSQILANQQRPTSNDFDDVLSKSLISSTPRLVPDSRGLSILSIMLLTIVIAALILVFVGFFIYRRDKQKVTTWKKTISEHFVNKFYMPSTVDHHHQGPSPNPQNIYDRQQHLIYSAGSAHMVQQSGVAKPMWTQAANGIVCSNGTGSLSSQGGLLPINSDPEAIRARMNNEQILLINSNKDSEARVIRSGHQTGPLVEQVSVDSSRSLSHYPSGNNQHQHIVHQGGDYYSVINNVAEYEELNQQQRSNMQFVISDRHQAGSSNSDTSCPSSVTRLLPKQNYNRDLVDRGHLDAQRYQEMILQHQISCNKQPFITMIGNNENSNVHAKAALSPYATTNLMNHIPDHQQQQIFVNSSMNLMDHTRQQQNFMMPNSAGNSTMDDSSKVFMAQRMTGAQNPVASFRTLQRTPINFKPSGSPTTQIRHNQVSQPIYAYRPDGLVTTIASNPMADAKSNLYEHIDYNSMDQQSTNNSIQISGLNSQHEQNELVSSSTSSGSVKSPPQLNSYDQQQTTNARLSGLRKGSGNPNSENEAHDLRVFSSAQASSRPVDFNNGQPERADVRLFNAGDKGENAAGEYLSNQIEGATSFKRGPSQSDSHTKRQSSKRKRQQQRSRLHNSNQETN